MSMRLPSGAAFTSNLGDLWLPDRTGLIYEGRLGTSDAVAKKNWAGGADGIVSTGTGVLVHSALGTTFTGNDSVHKRIGTGVAVPAGTLGMMVLAKKNGAIAILESIDGTARTGIVLASTTITGRNMNTTGQPLINWPADIAAKYLCIWLYGRERDFPRIQYGVGGTHLAISETADPETAATGTSGGTARTGVGELVWGRSGGGTGTSEAAGGAVWSANDDVLKYDFRIATYKRLRNVLGAANIY